MKIWIRLLTDNKLVKDKIWHCDTINSTDKMESELREICHELDIPTPVVLDTHFINFVRFHNAKFRQDDFVETLDYDIMIVEDCKE